MTPRVRAILERDGKQLASPQRAGYGVFRPAAGMSNLRALRNSTRGRFKTLSEEAAKNNEKPMRPFVLYSLRHTFLTRLGESGRDVWTLARIAGHSNVSMSSRYVHPSLRRGAQCNGKARWAQNWAQ